MVRKTVIPTMTIMMLIMMMLVVRLFSLFVGWINLVVVERGLIATSIDSSNSSCRNVIFAAATFFVTNLTMDSDSFIRFVCSTTVERTTGIRRNNPKLFSFFVPCNQFKRLRRKVTATTIGR